MIVLLYTGAKRRALQFMMIQLQIGVDLLEKRIVGMETLLGATRVLLAGGCGAVTAQSQKFIKTRALQVLLLVFTDLNMLDTSFITMALPRPGEDAVFNTGFIWKRIPGHSVTSSQRVVYTADAKRVYAVKLQYFF
ncbi:hypothetical protein llap_14144 [Limosa lapponica baueri]|uniref:Uncharacterized protein n=1 Tax=Limosa lapponica baueri TaxID=1758121 RepID=A0A2I0TP37_LIMLA|nr:hypothetical protein llap_14144 [Limosa lapponica baueri]